MANAIILIVGMPDSIHLSRWLKQVRGASANFVVVGTSPYRALHQDLVRLLGENLQFVELFPPVVLRGRNLTPAAVFLMDQLLGDRLRGFALRRLILKLKPHLVHVNELRVGGFPLSRAIRSSDSPRMKVWSTNYGNELSWFSRSRSGKAKLVKLLARSDAFSAECIRDVELALELGFQGAVMPTVPVSGGLEVRDSDPEKRTTIAVKGYDNRWGMGAMALEEVVKAIADSKSKELNVVAYSCDRKTLRAARILRRKFQVPIEALKKGECTHQEMLDLFNRALIYVGASKSDGVSTSVLEAMSQGAFPIQTDSSCADEWFRDGTSGLSVETGRVGQIYSAVCRVLNGSFDLTKARAINREVIRSRIDPQFSASLAIGSYKTVLLLEESE